jgi:hypothetical protein
VIIRRVKPSDAPTVKAKRTPLVLCVGLGAAFVQRCEEVAARAYATVVSVEAGSESSVVMGSLPSVVVMLAHVASSSPLGAIAGELGIELVTIAREDLPGAELDEQLTDALAAARARWRTSYV